MFSKSHAKKSSPPADITPSFDEFKLNATGLGTTTNQGVYIVDDANSLLAGARGPTLLEDHILREKITHFDHERIPERVVHARGAGAHGYFQVYDDSLKQFTKAKFLIDPSLKTPVFTRFSTVGGSRGSADTVRDVRGFATKFYTQEGNYDLVGNNMPVFFIQDAIKFPDFVHAVKPEPENEIPQASSAHNTLYDFVWNQPETAHMMMWLMSDRAIPRAYANMEGFGVHTWRFVNDAGNSTFVKFHWKPVGGLASLVWDEAQKICGKDGDFNRRQMWESIEAGDFPTWELGVQLITDADADSFDYDILDATKLVPEEQIPIKIVGRMILNQNPSYYFGETEQVAFCVSHLVPGIDFTNDPLLQGRIFSYLDTQISRLGGPNFHEIPINRPLCPFANNQRDGMHRMTINVGKTAYDQNALSNGWPKPQPANVGFTSYPQAISGQKQRMRSKTFDDHFSQATLFYNSITSVEQDHLVSAWSFELTKVDLDIRQNILSKILINIHPDLVKRVAANLGLPVPTHAEPRQGRQLFGTNVSASPLLSVVNPNNMGRADPASKLATRKIAILVADGVDAASIETIKAGIVAAGGSVKVLSTKLGSVQSSTGTTVMVDDTVTASPSVVFDAVAVPGGKASVDALSKFGDAVHFVAESYKHAKPIAAVAEGQNLLVKAGLQQDLNADGVAVGQTADAVVPAFVTAIGNHRAWGRTDLDSISA